MKIERLHSRSPPLRHPLSIEETLGGEGVQLSSTTVDQLLAQLTAKAPMSKPTINPVVAKGKENLYTKHEIDKYYRCSKPEHKFNECPKRRQVNMAYFEGEDKVQIETELKDSDFTEEYGDPITCVVQKLLCN